MSFGPDGEEALFQWRSMTGKLRLAEVVATHWRGEFDRLRAVVEAHGIDVCTCAEAPYYGAQHAGSVPACERCGKVTGL